MTKYGSQQTTYKLAILALTLHIFSYTNGKGMLAGQLLEYSSSVSRLYQIPLIYYQQCVKYAISDITKDRFDINCII